MIETTVDRRAHLKDRVLFRAFYEAASSQCDTPVEMPPHDPRLLWVLQFLGPRDSVIDLGAHKLDMTVHFVPRTTGRIVAVDISEIALHAGKTQRPGTERIEVCVADACAAPFADGAFDVAVLAEIIEHVPDEWALIAEAERLVRPGGWIAITVPSNADGWDRLGDRAIKSKMGFELDAHVREFVPARVLRGRGDLVTHYVPQFRRAGVEYGHRCAAWRVS